jgi:CheY-like chemotaxis protein
MLLISVWDHGIGINEKDLDRLFRPFVQLDAGLARESSGTGLGLALVAQMARLHGGSVSVFSEAGNGSRFTLILPWVPATDGVRVNQQDVTSVPVPIVVETKNRKTILLVDDTESVLMLYRDYLERHGYKVELANDGVEGVRRAIELRPDLILMDVMMPGMNGIDATKRIRREECLSHVPIIALTALAMPSDRQRCLDAGMSDYISKPISLNELLALVKKHLSESS